MEKEWKIGEIKQVNGEWYQCIKSDSYRCDYCDYGELGNCDDIACRTDERKDGKEVYFKKLEKTGEPYEYFVQHKGTVMLQPYKLFTTPIINGVVCNVNYDTNTIDLEIKQTKEDMEEKKKQTSLDLTKGIYEKFKGKTVQCLVNNKDGDLVNGYGIVCGYTNKYLIIGFTNGYEGCIKSFTDNVFLENRDFLSYRFWNISHVDDKPFIKPFNLEAARSGKPVYTRDGRKARIICFDRKLFYKKVSYPILALVERSDGEDEVCAYNEKGKVLIEDNAEYKDDLMMLPEKKEGWINVYRLNTCYKTKEEAEANIDRDYEDEYVRTVKINWEE